MFAFYLVWPYMGLGAALLLTLLLTTDALRSDRTVSRWRDLVWLAWLGTLAYLIHQFEEHGIDALGRSSRSPSPRCPSPTPSCTSAQQWPWAPTMRAC